MVRGSVQNRLPFEGVGQHAYAAVNQGLAGYTPGGPRLAQRLATPLLEAVTFRVSYHLPKETTVVPPHKDSPRKTSWLVIFILDMLTEFLFFPEISTEYH